MIPAAGDDASHHVADYSFLHSRNVVIRENSEVSSLPSFIASGGLDVRDLALIACWVTETCDGAT